MKRNRIALVAALGLAALSLPAASQSQVSAVAVNPADFTEVWACNRDNASVSVIDTSTSTVLFEIPVGENPRSLAFSADGSRVFVANQRGNVPYDAHFLTPFTGTEERGTVSVIDVASHTVTTTLNDEEVGVEPYGVAVAPNGAYFAVTAFRSGYITFFDAATNAQVLRYDFQANLDFIPNGMTLTDLDANLDGLSDEQDPRGFAITADSARVYVTHNKSPYISVLDLTLDTAGLPTSATSSKISIDLYPFHPIHNPTPVQILKSQGVPRFMEDIALAPDGAHALVPHLLHNVNHDVNFDFTTLDPNFAGDFSNRVYPALTVLDTTTNTFNPGTDDSTRLHNELSDDPLPAQFVPFGTQRQDGSGNFVELGGVGPIVLNQNAHFVLDWPLPPGWSAQLWVGRIVNIPMGPAGTMFSNGRFKRPFINGQSDWLVPPFLVNQIVSAQAVVLDDQGTIIHFSNPLKMYLSAAPFQPGTMGHRAGHPERVLYNSAGDHALMLNRGSEDLFLYDVSGSQMTLHTVYPPRAGFVERAPFDLTTPVGDLPLGMALVDDPTTTNDDSLLYIINEVSRSLSVIRVNWTTSTMYMQENQIPTLLGSDVFNQSILIGNELFEDASRPETTGNFNNSCASCHFEGGDDANVWQRPVGPRSTTPTYGGSDLTGLILWKGVRLNMGETGPMFAGENGGTGVLSNTEQQALTDYHAAIPVPLNPNFDTATSSLTATAQLGKDLFFGENLTGLNPTQRRAGCATCHSKVDSTGTQTRFFTEDHLDPQLVNGNVANFDPFCVSLQENIVSLNIRNVNSAVNVDSDGDGIPDPDRNFDGFIDTETYTPMNNEKDDDFVRDDTNSYMCPADPIGDPNGAQKLFTRNAVNFSIPTKLGVFSTPPYMHDHSLYSLRAVVDPDAQMNDPVYGDPSLNGTFKFFNEFHDVRGHEDFVQGASKVQLDLQSTNVDADIDAILSFIESL